MKISRWVVVLTAVLIPMFSACNKSETKPPPASTAYIELPAPNPTAPAKTVKLPVQVGATYAVYQGDILFPLGAVSKASATGVGAQGNRMQDGYCLAQVIICWDRSYLWPNKTLYYQLDSSVSAALQASIAQAVQIYLDRTGLRLVGSASAANRVLVREGSSGGAGGSSQVGQVGGVQEIILTRTDLQAVLHEFGHALGLWHEQSRADRGGYIRILEGNIKDDFRSQYRLLDDPDLAHPDGPYDFASIMHYPALDSGFAINPKLPVFELVNPGSYDINKVGAATDLSPGDVLALANLYDAPVTDGSIQLVLKGSGTLLNGGKATLEVQVTNAGPRALRDLYFGIQSDKRVTMSGGGGLACGATDGNPAGNPVLCYVPVGPNSGQSRRYGPITVEVPADAPSGTVNITLGVKPVGTRLADPSKGVSKVRLQQVRVDPDRYEVDNSFDTAYGIHPGDNQNRTLHVSSDMDYLFVDASDASESNAYVLSLDAQDTSESLGQTWFNQDRTPAVGLPQYITKPGKFYVAVSGPVTRYQAQLSTIDYKRLKDLLLNLPHAPLVFKWGGGAIPRTLVNPSDLLSLSGSGLRSVTLRASNAQIGVYDQFGEIYGRGLVVGEGLLQVEVPPGDVASTKQFFLKVERQNNTVVAGNLVLEQPAVEYSVAGCGPNDQTCPIP